MAVPPSSSATPPPEKGASVGVALGAAARVLEPVSDSPRLDAELLMAHAMGVTREAMILRHLGDAVPGGFEALVARRLGHEPVAYITGRRAFWTIELAVGPGVLIPRPDSETLLEAAVEYFGARAPARILDLGTGPGTLLLAALAEWPEAQGLGVDASQAALAYAVRNAGNLGLAARARFQEGNWTQGLDGRYDLILANPPYIGTAEMLPEQVREHEPHAALFAGPEGLDDYRRIVPHLRRLLAPGGAAILEIGWTQAEAVSALAKAQGFAVTLYNDLGSRPRALLLS
jgi:release factor glutamine methyltransferase